MNIFPEPQIAEMSGGVVRIDSGAAIVLGEGASELERYAASLVENALGAGNGIRVVVGTQENCPAASAEMLNSLDDKPNSDQGYVLRIAAGEIILGGKTPLGALYAAQTLLQMIERDGSSIVLSQGRIIDWPERKYRGIFAESRWCSELMTLQDWKDAIDVLASLKFNVFDVGVANNWMIQYEGKRSEIFMLPIRKYPQLQRPQSIEYYSAQKGDYVRAEYLPKMFTEDFFGEVVAYGKSRGITVYPHFNTPGHNTLIPRIFPETSARDEDGHPTGFGFCLSNPKTYELMFNILDDIADRYLLPNGVRFFHLGLDEVWEILGMDEDEPSRVVSPFCKCEMCKDKEWYDLFVDYVIKLCKHLVDRGFEKVGLWHDSFVRGGKMNSELAERFRKEGLLDKVVLHWWRYGGFFDTIHPEIGIESWVVPMTGYYYWTPLSDHIQNIYLASQKAAEENAAGAESYCVYYNAYYMNYACLAEYSWKSAGAGGPDAFRDKYAHYLFGDSAEGADAFKKFSFVTGPMAHTNWCIYHYSNSYAINQRSAITRANYPQSIVEQIWDDPAGVLHNLGMICENARGAKRIFEREDLLRRNPAGIAAAYAAEMGRAAASAHLFMRLAQAVRAYKDMQLECVANMEVLQARAGEISNALKEMDESILGIENNIPAYMGPSMIRELTMQRRFGYKFLNELNAVIGTAGQGSLPDLDCMRINEVRWVGRAHIGDD